MLRVEISYADMRDMPLANDEEAGGVIAATHWLA